MRFMCQAAGIPHPVSGTAITTTNGAALATAVLFDSGSARVGDGYPNIMCNTVATALFRTVLATAVEGRSDGDAARVAADSNRLTNYHRKNGGYCRASAPTPRNQSRQSGMGSTLNLPHRPPYNRCCVNPAQCR
jgi:hypothetical protein